jgi:hypothetical protein
MLTFYYISYEGEIMNRIEILKSLWDIFVPVNYLVSEERKLESLTDLMNKIVLENNYPELVEYITKQVVGGDTGLKSRILDSEHSQLEVGCYEFTKRISEPTKFDQYVLKNAFPPVVEFKGTLKSLFIDTISVPDCLIKYVTDEDHPVTDYIHPALFENPQDYPFVVDIVDYKVRIVRVTPAAIVREIGQEMIDLVYSLPLEGNFFVRLFNKIKYRRFT